MRIAWTVQAVRDLRSVRTFIARENPRAAKAIADRIIGAVEQLGAHPASGRPGRLPNTRELVIPGTPFIVPYRVSENGVEILGVIHGARRWPEGAPSD